MKLFLTAALAMAATLGCDKPKPAPVTPTTPTTPAAAKFACKAHPEITSDKEGTCSKCNAKLEEKK